uniref:Uncharacterized protein n=1 Tax=Trypanosoma congolense (strain IL3000) TaxID=1068625 RepID=G0UPE2_TRYCI|nr:hypothetical protein, unlikely [Trypanosoma congolense IL3000]
MQAPSIAQLRFPFKQMVPNAFVSTRHNGSCGQPTVLSPHVNGIARISEKEKQEKDKNKHTLHLVWHALKVSITIPSRNPCITHVERSKNHTSKHLRKDAYTYSAVKNRRYIHTPKEGNELYK